MKTTIKKPLGQVKLLVRHRTSRGKIFKAGDIVDYYSIIERKDCDCGGKKRILYKVYQIKGGTIPTTKANKI